jgi:ISXO2-like transposase domain
VNAKNVKSVLDANLRIGNTTVMTDESVVYDATMLDFGHETVNHSAKEYVRGNVHINTAEGFFSQLKRSLDGTYHHVSAQHLHRYVSEFDYRYNTRKMDDSQRTALAIRKMARKRLQYRETKTT